LNSIKRYLFTILLCSGTLSIFAQQKIGLVLSGGGATGLAHIGVLKALEERGIPIHYITGTSAGALVGSMYAAGYSPEEIEAYYLVFEMLKLLGTTGASYGNDFDSLFVPFRCVASDITNKKSIVFSEGFLNQAVRASMTYPFYFNPIRVNGILMFDGGLYNNFPADIMYREFDPDFIIGSNVSYNAAPPLEDDLISQVKNMLVSYSDYNLPCEAGILIEPKSEISTFEFENVQVAIRDGYATTLKYIDSIELHVTARISKEELNNRRKAFRSRIEELRVSSPC